MPKRRVNGIRLDYSPAMDGRPLQAAVDSLLAALDGLPVEALGGIEVGVRVMTASLTVDPDIHARQTVPVWAAVGEIAASVATLKGHHYG